MPLNSDEQRAAYRRLWRQDPPEIDSRPPAVGAPIVARLPLDEQKLLEEWQNARDRIELLMHTAGVRVGSFIYHPYLEPLETIILKAWNLLGTPEDFAACLLLIEQMHDDAGAAALAYEELKVALGLGGDYWLPIEVAARQLQYLHANPVWQSLTHDKAGATEPTHADDTDQTPGDAD